jgi:aminopeptidase N
MMFQMQQAMEARQREEARQARISSGRKGIDQAFGQLMDPNDTSYKRYGQAVDDYYRPQIQKQYRDANAELTYRLADAGTLRSSMATEATADLSEQNDMNIAQMNSKVDSAKADLRNRVASEKNTALNQLYATEDPEMALTTALNGVKGVQLAQPDFLTPLGNIFNVATVGAANAVKAWQTQGGGGGTGYGTTPQSNNPFASSGRPVGDK